MSKIIILVCLLAIQLHKGIFWNSAGNEFITAFMENTLSLGFGTELRLVITALSPSTSVNVSIYNTSFNVILSLEENESKPVFIPASAELTGSLIFSNRIIVVRSDKLITILSINNKFDTADSSNIFPVDSLDTDYYVFSPRYKSGMSQFAVINYNQTNIILITLSGDVTYNGQNYQSGDNITVVLSAFEAFQLQSSISLTGTRIQSEYPIAVLSGNSRDYYTNPGSYDYLFEQLLPVKEWGRMFMVSSLASQNYFDIVTVIASERTEIYYNNGAMSGNISLQQAEHTEINLASSSSLIIKSTKAVMVMYTFTGGLIHDFTGFPFIMNIIPVESFSHTYVISATNLTASYIRIIAKEPVLSGILKENGLSNNQLMNFVNLTEYAWADVALGAINETIVMKYCLPFGAYIYDRIRFIDIGTTALAVNGKPSFLDQPSCETADVTVRSMTNGSVFVNWTKDVCLYSYILTLTKSDNTAVMEEKVVQGSSVVFGGPYASSDYNLTFQAVIEDKKCLPLSKQFTHFGFSWTSAGTEFITAFVQNHDNSNLDVSHLVITALSPSTSVRAIMYNTSFEAALTLGEGETSFVNIPAFAELHGTIFSSNNTVIVRSDKPITVSSFSYKPVTADSADIFPVDILGTEYYVFTPIGGYGMSEVAVINYNQTNELLITVAGALMYNGINYNSGDNITLVLSAFEAIQLQSTTVLTGTRIQSEYRVAVLSGSSCDTYNGTCDDMFEQLLPVNKWGKKFLVAPIAVQGYTDIVTVVASQRTEISYSTANWSNSTELHQGQSTTISLSSSSSLYLTATEPVMVMYTFTGGNYNGYTAEQFIMNILPFESFSSSYVISTENNFNNYIQLVAKASVISEILQSNNILSNVSIQGNVPMTDFAWANIELGQRNQSFIIKHCSAFAVYMYGTLSFTGFGTTALAMNEFQTCQTSNMTMTYLTDGSVLVTWPNGICVDSYLLQISRPETSIVVKEKMMYGNFTVLTGLQACSVYNSTLWAVFEGEKCLPQMKQFTYFGLQRCKSFNMTVTSMDNGDVLVTWPRVGCVDSYFLQISAHGSYSTLQQQNTYGNSAVFYGLQLCSAYNLTIQTVFQGENCLPLTQQFTHSGTKPCEISNVTLQLNTDGSILVKWTNSDCAESYHVQLLESGSSDVVEEKMVYGNSTVFPGPYARSVYNISILPIIPNEQCLPHVEKFSHSGILWNNAGTEFIIALITSVNYGHSAYQLVITSISSSTFVNITIFNTSFEAALTLEEGETTNITIPNSAELLADAISSNRTVIVRSNKPITVFYFSYGWSMAESCSIFPVNLLGTQYYVFSPLYSHGTPEFAIINYDQTNEILITLTGPVNYNGTYYQKGSNLTVVLSAFESLQIQSSASLTGTRIHSEYPIAVLSGNTCDTYNEGCNHVLEQLMPSNRWGRTFLVASIAAPNYTDIITIIASQETEITYSGVSNNTVTLQNGESFSIELLSSFSLVVKATERVMVMYTFTGGYYNGYKVNPFIMNIIPIESFSSSYVINVQSNHKNYIHVIAKTSLISEIQHDFANLSLIAVGNFVTKDNYTWAVAELQMINDSIIMKHCTPFAAYIYTIEDSTGMGTTAPSVNRASQCVDFNVTVTLQAYGFIQANWTNDACADNYKLQLSTAEGLYILQEEIIDGTSRIFFGLTVGSVYNLKIWAIIADKMCFPLTKQFKYCGIHMCDSLDLTVTSLANGAIQANWTKIQCVDSYHLQLHKADNSSMLEQKIVNGSMVIFTGPYNHSVYNVTLWAMYSDEQCPPLKKQVTHFGIHMCDSLDLTVTSLANGAIQANWTKIQFVDSYHLQLHKADNSFMLEQKIVNGSMVIFTGPYNHSVYNVTLWAMYSDEQCPPLEKQVTHFGKKTTVIAKAEVLAIGKEPIDEKLIKDAVENEVYDLLKPELHPFVKVRVVQV